MSSAKQLWVLAGGNGAGKSTFYRVFLQDLGVPFVNADILAGELHAEDPAAHSYEAAKVASKLRDDLLLEGLSYCYETVFSHPSKIDFLANAKALGYEVILVVIHLDNSGLNLARVAQRVSEGGHSVPDEKVKSRIPRTLGHLKTALPLCDEVWILDNSSLDSPFIELAVIKNGNIFLKQPALPAWAKELLDI